jgi:Ca2+-binding RTX toxin-like protein
MAKIKGTTLADVLQGGAEADRIFGYEGNDTLIGDANNDWLFGGKGNDGFFGGGLDDVIFGGSGHDGIYGDGGNDTVYGGSGNDTQFGGADHDTLYGGAGNDALDGGAGDDKLYGGTGDDVLTASTGNDSLVGGKGFDTADYSRLAGRLDVDLSKKTLSVIDPASGKVTASQSIEGIERFVAGAGDDHIKGGSGANMIEGGAGNDWIRGLGGKDMLGGGKGADTFVWLRKDADALDRITDFEVGVDKLDLADFLKGSGLKAPKYADLVELSASGDGGTLVQAMLKGGALVDIVVLDHVDAATVTLADLGL